MDISILQVRVRAALAGNRHSRHAWQAGMRTVRGGSAPRAAARHDPAPSMTIGAGHTEQRRDHDTRNRKPCSAVWNYRRVKTAFAIGRVSLYDGSGARFKCVDTPTGPAYTDGDRNPTRNTLY